MATHHPCSAGRIDASDNIPQSIDAVHNSALFDRLSVIARNGRILYDGPDSGIWRETFLSHWYDFGKKEESFVKSVYPIVEAGVRFVTPRMPWILRYALSESNEPISASMFPISSDSPLQG